MPVNTNFNNTNILYAANLNNAYANCANITGDNFSGTVVSPTFIGSTIQANTSLKINLIDIGSGLQNAYNAANGAFTKANSIGSSTLNTQTTYISSSSNPGLTVNTGVNIVLTGNNTLILGANAATTGQVGVVQLNDTTTSALTTQAGTANSVNTAMTYAQGAFTKANAFTGLQQTTYISSSSNPGLTVNTGVNITLSGNNTLILGANTATTGQVGVVQLNDTTTSVSTTQAGTANSVNTAMTYAQGAFANANNALSRSGGTVNGAITVTGNVVAGNIVTSGSVNSSSLMVTPIVSNTNYILSFRDNGNFVTFSNSGTTLINVNNNLSIGFRTILTQIGSGNVQIQAGPGVTMNPVSGIANQIATQWASATLFCYAANSFILDGSLI